MYRILCLGIIASLFTAEADAQQVWTAPWGYRHASTAAEGYLSGRARLTVANGIALRHFGKYLIDRETARSQAIDNTAKRIRTRWEIQDEYRTRQRRLHPTYPERMEKRLDMAEKVHALREREKALIDKGILPPKPVPSFTYKGHKFKNYAEFKKSDLYWDMIKERDARLAKREAEKKAAEARRQQAVEFGRMWAGMSWLAREKYSRSSPEYKARYKAEWKNPELMWKRLEDDRNRRFYEARPYLIPRAGKNGLPPYPGR